jgi:hypothetical protein
MPRVYCYAEKKEVEQSVDGSFDFNFDSPDESKESSELATTLNGIHDVVYSFREVHSKTQSNPVRVFMPHYEAVLSSCRVESGAAGALLGAQLLLRLKHLMQHDTFPGTPGDAPTNVTTAAAETETQTMAAPQKLSFVSKAHIRMTVFTTILPSAVPLSFGSSCLQTLNSLADSVLGVESFAGHADAVPIEFR